MFVDYSFYTDVYLGSKLTSTEFQKQAFKACNLITDETMTRVTDSTINNYPSELVEIIKKCACDLAEKYNDYDKFMITLYLLLQETIQVMYYLKNLG